MPKLNKVCVCQVLADHTKRSENKQRLVHRSERIAAQVHKYPAQPPHRNILNCRIGRAPDQARQNGGHHRVLATWHLGTSICPLPRVWPFLLILKEPFLVAMRPGRND